MNDRPIRVDAVAWTAGVLPLLGVNGAYLISAFDGLVPWCIPYMEGCTSISRAAREGDAIHLFRGTMLPYAAILALHWWLAAQWLRGFAPTMPRRRRWMLALGVIGAAFLALYATFIGIEGAAYQWMRRYGVTVYFSFTVLAQILLVSIVLRDPRLPAALRHSKLGLCLAMLGLGLASIPLQHLVADREAALNALEWSYALLMASYFPLTGLAWRRTGFGVRFRLEA